MNSIPKHLRAGAVVMAGLIVVSSADFGAAIPSVGARIAVDSPPVERSLHPEALQAIEELEKNARSSVAPSPQDAQPDLKAFAREALKAIAGRFRRLPHDIKRLWAFVKWEMPGTFRVFWKVVKPKVTKAAGTLWPFERKKIELHVQGPRPDELPAIERPGFHFREAGDLQGLLAGLKPMPSHEEGRFNDWYKRANGYSQLNLNRMLVTAQIFREAPLEGEWFKGKRIQFRLNTSGHRPILRQKRRPVVFIPMGFSGSLMNRGLMRFEHPYYIGYALSVEAEVTNTTDKPLQDVQIWASRLGCEQVQQQVIGTLQPGQTARARFSFFFKDRWMPSGKWVWLNLAGAPDSRGLEDLGHTIPDFGLF